MKDENFTETHFEAIRTLF